MGKAKRLKRLRDQQAPHHLSELTKSFVDEYPEEPSAFKRLYNKCYDGYLESKREVEKRMTEELGTPNQGEDQC